MKNLISKRVISLPLLIRQKMGGGVGSYLMRLGDRLVGMCSQVILCVCSSSCSSRLALNVFRIYVIHFAYQKTRCFSCYGSLILIPIPLDPCYVAT